MRFSNALGGDTDLDKARSGLVFTKTDRSLAKTTLYKRNRENMIKLFPSTS